MVTKAAGNGVTWVVVADGAAASIFQAEGRDSAITVVKIFAKGDGAEPVSELVSDHPGRSWGVGGGRHAMAPHTDPKQVAKDAFLRALVAFLHDADHRGAFDGLVLVASARPLGRLRALLPDHIASKLVAEVRKNLTKVPAHALRENSPPRSGSSRFWPPVVRCRSGFRPRTGTRPRPG